MTEQLTEKAVSQTQYWIDLANDMYDSISIIYPIINFNLRGRAAGQFRVRSHQKEIRYNPILLSENGDKFLNRTVPHEVAHLVVYSSHGFNVKAHGYEWQKVMRDFGLEPSRCHSYDTSNSRAFSRTTIDRSYQYKCVCKLYSLTSIRHRKILKGITYVCKLCGQMLEAV